MRTVNEASLKSLSHRLRLIDGKMRSPNTSIDDATALLEVKNLLISSDPNKVTRLMRMVGVTEIIGGIMSRITANKASLTLDRGNIAVSVKHGEKEIRQFARPVDVVEALKKTGLKDSDESYPIAKAYLEHPDMITVLAAGEALEKIERTIEVAAG